MCMCVYFRVNHQLQALETEHGVLQRWKVGDEAYEHFLQARNLSDRTTMLQNIQKCARHRWFLLAVKAKFSGMYIANK